MLCAYPDIPMSTYNAASVVLMIRVIICAFLARSLFGCSRLALDWIRENWIPGILCKYLPALCIGISGSLWEALQKQSRAMLLCDAQPCTCVNVALLRVYGDTWLRYPMIYEAHIPKTQWPCYIRRYNYYDLGSKDICNRVTIWKYIKLHCQTLILTCLVYLKNRFSSGFFYITPPRQITPTRARKG